MLILWPLAVTPGVTHFGAYHRPPDGHFLNIDLSNAVLYFSQLCLFKLPVRGSKVKLAIISIMNMVWLFSPPTPHIDLSDAVSRLYSPSLFYRCCLLKISSSSNIIRGLSHIFTITMMTMAVLCQDRDLTCPFPARVLTFMWESKHFSGRIFQTRGWKWDTCGNSWWFTGTGVKVPAGSVSR